MIPLQLEQIPIPGTSDEQVARRRRAYRRLLLTLLLVLIVKLAFEAFGDVLWTRGMAAYWQERCMDYALPADRIAFVAAPAGAALPDYLADFSDAYPSIWTGTVAAAPYPVELTELRKSMTPQKQAVPWERSPSPAFLHGLKNPQGKRRLVTVNVLANNPAGWWTLVTIVREPAAFGAARWGPPHAGAVSWPITGTPGSPLVIYAGQPSATDASSFTLRVTLNGQDQIVTGTLGSDDVVRYTTTSGLQPWDTQRAGGLVIPPTPADLEDSPRIPSED